MNFTKQKPETLKTITCEKHGDYQERCIPFFGKYMVNDVCPKCVEAEQMDLEKMEKEMHQKRLEENAERIKKNCGISLRNQSITFQDFIADTPEKENAKRKVYDFTKALKKGEKPASMILSGKVGTGKTMLACAAVNALYASRSCKLIKMIDMFRSLKETWRNDSQYTETQLIEKYSKLDLLVIDEAGVNYDSNTEKMFLFDIIDGRYQNMKPTVIISNLNIEDLKALMGDRVIDRLRDGGGEVVAFTWESGRA